MSDEALVYFIKTDFTNVKGFLFNIFKNIILK